MGVRVSSDAIRLRTGKGLPPAALGDLHVGHHMSTTGLHVPPSVPRASSVGESCPWWAGGLRLWSSP